MFLNAYILYRFTKHWNGPGVTFVVGNKEVHIGQGDSLVTVRFRKSWTFSRLALLPSLGFGEGYMKGDISIEGDNILKKEVLVQELVEDN